ncbi:MAG: TIGR04282 family arsenosugar biosynthesis glycosyltransferase [Candidatus Cloacimonetes bacterium]|nr:TIGR04282 family arsenosugar biosynthesis glycosyltransferase [Candidatus Cloacimonadota bacterium]MCF7812980.1 TIGR04282 family arsenosugar biosynthesis glycosyltransferase [Candidatus Cloacimonadota bacterium]MCF7867288.1 TIGR04282 family arsenosugar biosynthesis glycosyltransferase [Candidatus Cloacimonadota bacterium]MCF7882732.1 TIGR04282 family arsenosugar biosynthesis glycosyltransferase [Candidatus Cloacimonadota bacterium]
MKSRLARTIGAEKAAEIYKVLLLDNWQRVIESGLPVGIEYSPAASLKNFQQLLGLEQEFNLQSGNGMGGRMANAFAGCFRQPFDAAVLIGADVPELSAELILEAAASLKKHDVVLGPAEDGGYYLIGFTRKSFDPQYFQRISWSTDQVFQQTTEKVLDNKNKLYIISKRCDFDNFDDVKEFLGKVSRNERIAQEIRRILNSEVIDENSTDNNIVANNFKSGSADRNL